MNVKATFEALKKFKVQAVRTLSHQRSDSQIPASPVSTESVKPVVTEDSLKRKPRAAGAKTAAPKKAAESVA